MKIMKNIGLSLSFLVLLSGFEYAEDRVPHKLVIQVSTDDLRTWKMELNNAVNLQKLYGIDNVEIEVVAYGPGFGLVTTKSS